MMLEIIARNLELVAYIAALLALLMVIGFAVAVVIPILIGLKRRAWEVLDTPEPKVSLTHYRSSDDD